MVIGQLRFVVVTARIEDTRVRVFYDGFPERAIRIHIFPASGLVKQCAILLLVDLRLSDVSNREIIVDNPLVQDKELSPSTSTRGLVFARQGLIDFDRTSRVAEQTLLIGHKLLVSIDVVAIDVAAHFAAVNDRFFTVGNRLHIAAKAGAGLSTGKIELR